MRERFDEAVAQCAQAFAEPAFELPGRRAQREIGLRADQIHHGLGLREIHFSMKIRALRELARFRRPRAAPQQEFEDAPRNQHAAMAGNLDHILARVARGRAEDREQHIVQLARAIVDRAEMHHAGGRFFFPAENPAGHLHRARPAQAQQRERAFAEGRGDGGDGVIHARE